jgi:defect-in-organelle-trafficking protein DotB
MTLIQLPDEPARFTPYNMDNMLEFASSMNASDITIQSNEPIFADIYGRLVRITSRHITNSEVSEIINAIYGPNATTQLLSGQDIDTHYEFRPTRGERYRFRVNATSCLVSGHDGIQITLRTIPTTPPKLSTMNLPQEVLDAIAPQEGIVFVTGATGSGKSTLLAAIIRDLIDKDDSNRKVLTYESPIEFVYDDIPTTSAVVSQSEIPRHLPSFSDGIRNALRRKPKLILVGECRDSETISAALEAALTGHPVYTTLHTSGVAETMRRLVTSFDKEERQGKTIDIVETIKLCIWQKLVPTVDGKRVALREYLVFNEKIRDLLLECDPDDITNETRKMVRQYGRTMITDAKEKFESGIICEKTFKILSMGSKESVL